MADKLVFPIGFDLEAAVKSAGDDWEKKYAKRLEDLIAKRPVNVKLKLDDSKLDSLDAVKKRLAELKIEPITPETKTAIKELAAELRTLAKALEQVQKYSTGRVTASPDAVRAARIDEINKRKEAKLAVEREKARTAAARASQAELKLEQARARAATAATRSAEATRRANQEYRNQDGYISRLIKRLGVYAAFSYSARFLTSIREVTAEFELQRVSLGAIIQDQQKANQLFAEIKSFALTSPLKILDLTKYAKQVAAYGFETERIFDVTKRLADISVGLGVNMGRLTLAVSQIKAATVLKSSELRQLTETGLPMLDLLSKKLSETQGKIISTAEVMDLISKRAISYEMVEEVLYDLTNAGGMFYNMQVKQSQTLFGMWSKLGDAAALMYDQIGNTSSVNSAMKTTIGLLEKMMRNWQTTGTWIGTLAIGMGTYAIVLKNASIASNALTVSEARRLAITKAQVIATPKLVAAIIGQNAAIKLSTVLTKAHTAAMLKQSVATNVLSRAFWGLSAAMLANPWAIALAAVVAAGYAIYQFTTRVETAADRTEKLNNAVASLKNLDDTVKPLIDTYNELIDKTERTAEEEKKLSEVTHELAKRYPGAITAIGNFGNEVDLATDKLNKLYQAEKNARMENTRYELGKTEEKIKETESEIEKLQQQLSSGTKTVYKRLGDSGLRTKKIEPLTEEDKGKILKRIDELRFGEDGQSGLVGLQQSAEDARRALGLIPSEAEAAVEKFGAWKKTLSGFGKYIQTEVTDKLSKIRRIRLFDDSTINQFSSLEDALKETAKKYKENIALVKTYDDVLKSTTLTAEERAKIETERAEADAMATLAKKALDYYNTLPSAFDKGSGRQSDPRLNNLKEEISLTKKLYDEYKKLEKQIGATKAAEKIQEIYSNTIKTLQGRAKKYGFTFQMPFTDENLKANLQQFINRMKELQKLTDKKGKPLFPNIGKDIDEAVAQLEDVDFNSLQKALEQKLKDLSDRISRTKTAKEFYDKILSQTGDAEIAATLTMNVYGNAGEDLFQQTVEQIQTYFSGVEVDLPINFDTQQIDYKALRKLAERMRTELGEASYKGVLSIADNAEKDAQKMIEGWLKATEKAKTYGDKLADVYRTTATEIERIQKAIAIGDIDKGIGTDLIAGYQRKQAEEIAKLQYEAFKDSPMYVQMFDDLDNASTRMLENMRNRLIAMQGQWKNLDPTQLKELQSRLNEIDKQLAKRNPFSTLTKAIKKYRDYMKNGEGDGKTKSAKEAEDLLMTTTKAADDARKKYDELIKKYGEGSEKSVKEVIDAKKELDEAMANEEAAQKAVENWKKVEDAIGLSSNELLQMLNWAGDIAKAVADISEALGADEEDVEYWNTVVDSLGEIAGGIQDIVSAAMSGNVVGIISSVLTAIPKMFVGFVNLFNAGRIKKANKEIKRQAELLENLQYTYSRLQKAEEKVFGSDYIRNYNQQLKNLQAQAEAYQKQMGAEKSKGKKADKDKIKEYEDAWRDTLDEIADMHGKLMEKITGTNVESAARDFANAWLDAYVSFSDTTEAIKDKFKDLIKNMIVESVMAKTVQMVLQPLFDEAEKMYRDGASMTEVLTYMFSQADQKATEINDGLMANAKLLESLGVDLKSLREGESNFTGIKRDIAGASEETMSSVATIGNTLMYYVSPIPGIAANVALLTQHILNGNASAVPTANAGVDFAAYHTESLQHLNTLTVRTSEILAECQKLNSQTKTIADALGRVVVYKGNSHGIKVYM